MAQTAAQYRDRILKNYEFHSDSCEFYQNADIEDDSYDEFCDCDLIELLVDFELAVKREQAARTEKSILAKIEADTGISISREET